MLTNAEAFAFINCSLRLSHYEWKISKQRFRFRSIRFNGNLICVRTRALIGVTKPPMFAAVDPRVIHS